VQVRGSIIRTVTTSVVYALIEAYYVNLSYGGGVISPYHALVFLIGLIVGSDRNMKIWVANVLLYSVLEDDLFWVFTSQLPSQWDPMYVVIGNFPIYYVPFLSMAIMLYVKGLREEENAEEAE
jgi:hypothetical protein